MRMLNFAGHVRDFGGSEKYGKINCAKYVSKCQPYGQG